jgi:starch synthase
MGSMHLPFTIIKEKHNQLHFDLYCVDTYGLLDREKVYGYEDDAERFMAFQIAVMEWLRHWQHHPDVVHVHDNHAALIPFMLRHCYAYVHLSHIKTILTIHNAQYQGWMGWEKSSYIPSWDPWKRGLLEWNHTINPLAAGIKCADKVNTVSPGYMQELVIASNGLETLFQQERHKCVGILNGIDYDVWNPAADPLIQNHYAIENLTEGKRLNKQVLCEAFGLDPQLPLFIFIGRLVAEKAADLLPEAITQALQRSHFGFSCLVLGNGDPAIEDALQQIHKKCFGYYHSQIQYNETLSHEMYAGADFLLMPSRVEPCGLNQLYAIRYGTIPVVRRTGGLNDTVVDFEDPSGYGICFQQASVEDIVQSIQRGIALYKNASKVDELRKHMMNINNSWEKSANDYIHLYQSASFN